MKERVLVFVMVLTALLTVVCTVLLTIALSDLNSLKEERQVLANETNALRSLIISTNGNVSSVRSEISRLISDIQEPMKLVKGNDYRLVRKNLEMAELEVRVVFSQVSMGEEFKLILIDEASGETSSHEMEKAVMGYSAVLELDPFKGYYYYISASNFEGEIYSDRYHLPREVYGYQNYKLTARAINQGVDVSDQLRLEFFLELSGSHFDLENYLIDSASIRVLREGKLVDTLAYSIYDTVAEDSRQESLAGFMSGTLLYYVKRGELDNHEFYLDVEYPLGGKLTQKIDVKL